MSSNPATDNKADRDFESADSGKILRHPQFPRNELAAAGGKSR
jgi:hypothetical protein